MYNHQTIDVFNPRNIIMKKHDHHLFLNWLILAGVIIALSVICWDLSLIQRLIESDRSNISIGICLIYLLGMLHCGIRAWQLSSEQLSASRTSHLLKRHDAFSPITVHGERITLGGKTTLPRGIVNNFLVDSLKASQGDKSEDNSTTLLAEIYSDRVKTTHDYGWFFVDAMIKLGLLGTIIGFIFMLSSVSGTTELDLNAMQKVMQQMSAGMGTALYTTMAGLIGSLMLALQYQMLDRAADDLIQEGVYLTEVHVLPKLEKN